MKFFDFIKLQNKIRSLKKKNKKLVKEFDEQLKNRDSEIEMFHARYQFQLKKQAEQYKTELNTIREQERSTYQSIIDEKNDEILRIREDMHKKRRLFDSLKEQEVKILELTDSVVLDVKVGLDHISKGYAYFGAARDKVKTSNLLNRKDDNKLLFKLSEG